DTLAHTLSGLAVNLEAVTVLWNENPDQAHNILDQSLNVTRSGLVETRRAIQALRASPLDDLGLKISLEQLARSTAERYTLKLELDLPAMLENLDPVLEHCLFRVAEEGLRNIGQHARASQFSMRLRRSGKQLDFTLSDDGVGFDQAANLQDEAYGIRGMRERVEAVGGIFELTSQPGNGTQIHVSMDEGGEQ
ncbi:MAG: sensor histidine kinase, partial [Anaerolineaceae bacterium]|nr:sensor histidine kinase [Anaerolineaceae bacterium]